MRSLLCSLLALALFSSTAWAGKNDEGTVSVRNDSTLTAAVIIDPPATLPANPTLAEFQNAGGRILNAGATENFKVKSGNHLVVAQLVDNNGAFVGATTQQTVTANRNQTLRLGVSGTTGAVITPL